MKHTIAVFGLTLAPEFEVHGLDSVDPSSEHALRLRLGRMDELQGWHDGRAEALFGRREDDGSVTASLHRHPELGHRLFARGFGTYVISVRLDELVCVPPDDAASWDWQRFLVGHALPLAAVLSGLEVFHASAVALDGSVLAFVAGSGAGKSSLALNLLGEGARLFTDDVLSLELTGAAPATHPGPGVMTAAPAEWASIGGTLADEHRGRVIGGDEDGLRVVIDHETRALPLGGIYFIERSALADRIQFERVQQASRLLGATFNLSLVNPDRLRTHLEVCAAVASNAELFQVAVPAPVGARETAARIAEHAAR